MALIPSMDREWADCAFLPSLTSLWRHSSQQVCHEFALLSCLFYIHTPTNNSLDLRVEGIFRKNGNIKQLNALAAQIERDPWSQDIRRENAIQIAALMKKFLREMPEPLLTFKLYKLFLLSQSRSGLGKSIFFFSLDHIYRAQKSPMRRPGSGFCSMPSCFFPKRTVIFSRLSSALYA